MFSLTIINTSPKYAIKMINIQKSDSVHIGFIRSNLVHSVLFSPFCPLRSSLVLFHPFFPLWSYSVHFSSIWSYSVHVIHFGPLQSYTDLSVQFGPSRSILVLFGLPLSYSVHFSLIRFNLVPFCPFHPLWS